MGLHLYLLKFLYLIRLGFQVRRKYLFVVILRIELLQLIHFMYHWGFLYSYFYCNKKCCYVLELAYIRQQPVLSNIRFFLYHGYIPYVPFKILITLYLKEETVFYILYTSRGILLDKDAISLKLGGFILCSFY